MGFIEETGAAQHYRDAKITQIYEGTNGIQAMDLVGRKMPMRAGAVFGDQIARMRSTVAALEGNDELAGVRDALAAAVDVTERTGQALMASGLEDPVVALSVATPFQRLFAITVAGWLMARQAELAAQRLAAGDGDAEFLTQKLVTARFFARAILPEVHGLEGAATAGKDDLVAASF